MGKRLASISVIIISVIVLSKSSYSTQQEPSWIIYDGARYYLRSHWPLNVSIPDEDDPRRFSLEACWLPLYDFISKESMPRFSKMYTANRRGYRATYAIINKQLYLIGVEGKLREDTVNRIYYASELFPDISFPYEIKTYNGVMEFDGRVSDYMIAGDTITYIDKIFVYFKDGKVIEERIETHEEKRNDRIKRNK